MAKFIVNVSELNEGCVEIEADNEDSALKKAELAYFAGNVSWNSADYSFNVRS